MPQMGMHSKHGDIRALAPGARIGHINLEAIKSSLPDLEGCHQEEYKCPCCKKPHPRFSALGEMGLALHQGVGLYAGGALVVLRTVSLKVRVGCLEGLLILLNNGIVGRKFLLHFAVYTLERFCPSESLSIVEQCTFTFNEDIIVHEIILGTAAS